MPLICPENEFVQGRSDLSPGICTKCSNIECPDGKVRTGVCEGEKNGFTCECPPNHFEVGCKHITDQYRTSYAPMHRVKNHTHDNVESVAASRLQGIMHREELNTHARDNFLYPHAQDSYIHVFTLDNISIMSLLSRILKRISRNWRDHMRS